VASSKDNIGVAFKEGSTTCHSYNVKKKVVIHENSM
jgi:hypothetical protein